jgi:hypothetical protein
MTSPAAADEPPAAGERVREFPDRHCRYTLPGEGWSWRPVPETGGALAVARDDDGRVVILFAPRSKASARLDNDYAREFERGFLKPHVVRRDGRFGTFHGARCYDLGVKNAGGGGALVRVFPAHGFDFVLFLHDPGREAPERAPDFEVVMDGFQFTDPPPPGRRTLADVVGLGAADLIRDLVGGFVCFGALSALGLGLLWRLRRRPPPGSPYRPPPLPGLPPR